MMSRLESTASAISSVGSAIGGALGWLGSQSLTIVTLMTGQAPKVSRTELAKYVSFSSEQECMEKQYEVTIMGIPIVNRLFRDIKLDVFPFFDAEIELSLASVDRHEPLENGRHWRVLNKADHSELILLNTRESVPSRNLFELRAEVRRDFPRYRIESNLSASEVRDVLDEGGRQVEVVTKTVANKWDLTVKDYEVKFSLRTVQSLKLSGVWHVETRSPITQMPDDTTVLLETPIRVVGDRLGTEFGKFDEYLVVVCTELRPGTTKVVIEHEI